VSSLFSLSGRRAIVTGASRGIGRAIALAYAEAGARVAVASRRQDGVDAVAREIEAAGGTALPVACHVGRREDIDALVDRVVGTWGGVDVLVNNAGTNPAMAPLSELDEAIWDKILDVNLKAAFLLCRRIAPVMTAAGGGSIVNMSSVAGTVPWPMLGAYSVSKAGLDSLTKVLARELGRSGIRVNAIAPGLIDTKFSAALMASPAIHDGAVERTALGRHGVPDDVVGAALFLASDASPGRSSSWTADPPCDSRMTPAPPW
jgi:NAD(P)-dependent dehydrogenase (short-subunit alcohol dehydrogenase family)